MASVARTGDASVVRSNAIGEEELAHPHASLGLAPAWRARDALSMTLLILFAPSKRLRYSGRGVNAAAWHEHAPGWPCRGVLYADTQLIASFLKSV